MMIFIKIKQNRYDSYKNIYNYTPYQSYPTQYLFTYKFMINMNQSQSTLQDQIDHFQHQKNDISIQIDNEAVSKISNLIKLYSSKHNQEDREISLKTSSVRLPNQTSLRNSRANRQGNQILRSSTIKQPSQSLRSSSVKNSNRSLQKDQTMISEPILQVSRSQQQTNDNEVNKQNANKNYQDENTVEDQLINNLNKSMVKKHILQTLKQKIIPSDEFTPKTKINKSKKGTKVYIKKNDRNANNTNNERKQMFYHDEQQDQQKQNKKQLNVTNKIVRKGQNGISMERESARQSRSNSKSQAKKITTNNVKAPIKKASTFQKLNFMIQLVQDKSILSTLKNKTNRATKAKKKGLKSKQETFKSKPSIYTAKKSKQSTPQLKGSNYNINQQTKPRGIARLSSAIMVPRSQFKTQPVPSLNKKQTKKEKIIAKAKKGLQATMKKMTFQIVLQVVPLQALKKQSVKKQVAKRQSNKTAPIKKNLTPIVLQQIVKPIKESNQLINKNKQMFRNDVQSVISQPTTMANDKNNKNIFSKAKLRQSIVNGSSNEKIQINPYSLEKFKKIKQEIIDYKEKQKQKEQQKQRNAIFMKKTSKMEIKNKMLAYNQPQNSSISNLNHNGYHTKHIQPYSSSIKNQEKIINEPNLRVSNVKNSYATLPIKPSPRKPNPKQSVKQQFKPNKKISQVSQTFSKAVNAMKQSGVYNEKNDPFNLADLSLKDLIKQAYETNILGFDLYHQFSSYHTNDDLNDFLDKFKKGKLRKFNFNRVKFVLLDHRRIAELLYNLFPNQYIIQSNHDNSTEQSKFLKSLYEQPAKEYFALYNQIDGISKITWWKDLMKAQKDNIQTIQKKRQMELQDIEKGKNGGNEAKISMNKVMSNHINAIINNQKSHSKQSYEQSAPKKKVKFS